VGSSELFRVSGGPGRGSSISHLRDFQDGENLWARVAAVNSAYSVLHCRACDRVADRMCGKLLKGLAQKPGTDGFLRLTACLSMILPANLGLFAGVNLALFLASSRRYFLISWRYFYFSATFGFYKARRAPRKPCLGNGEPRTRYPHIANGGNPHKRLAISARFVAATRESIPLLHSADSSYPAQCYPAAPS
jgi:hypothetical protein